MTFVFVHGGWHGGWCWRAVEDLLRAKGHRTFAPTMTGLGERRHLVAAVEGPETHVDDICNVIRYNELRDVVLVGHSYGGMIITGVASQMADRIAHLVYVDAFVPTQTNTPATAMADPKRAAEIKAAIQPDGTILPNGFERWSKDPEKLDWLKSLCTPHPAICYQKGVTLTGAEKQVARRTFVLAAEHKPSTFWPIYERYKDDPAWNVHALDCLHDVMVDEPEALARILESTL